MKWAGAGSLAADRRRPTARWRHLAATPAGRLVTGEAEVIKVDGRRIEFRIRAMDGAEEIGIGAHERMVIDLAKFSARLKAKFG